jgi:ADP-ribose pyrophosphatase YjhB (NUDIX family)
MKYSTSTPYIASYLIIRKDGKIPFVLRQNTGWMDGCYGLPSGKVEDGEAYSQAAIREAKEEIDVSVNLDDITPLLTCHRRAVDDDTVWVDMIFEAKEWSGEVTNAEPERSSEVAWLDPDNLPDNVIASTKFYLEQIAAGKTYCEYGWA